MSEEKVGPNGEPWHIEKNGPIWLIASANGTAVALVDASQACAEARGAWPCRWWDHAVDCVNALHAAGIKNLEALPRAMEVVAARAISSPEIDAALAALRREP